MYHNSQRTKVNWKPKWPRLQFLKRKSELDTLFELDLINPRSSAGTQSGDQP